MIEAATARMEAARWLKNIAQAPARFPIMWDMAPNMFTIYSAKGWVERHGDHAVLTIAGRAELQAATEACIQKEDAR